MPVVRCASCDAELTGELASRLDGLQEGQVPVPPGRWAIDPEPVTVEFWRASAPEGEVATPDGVVRETEPGGGTLVHPDDLHLAALADVRGRAGGCCGLDGTTGANQRCAACSLVVGTLQNSCSTPHVMRFRVDRVHLVPSPDRPS